MGPDFILTYYSTDFFPLLNRASSYHFWNASKKLLWLTLF